ncbi:hypothetical protein SSCG_05908, partial [Streptomyces clavuligerus]
MTDHQRKTRPAEQEQEQEQDQRQRQKGERGRERAAAPGTAADAGTGVSLSLPPSVHDEIGALLAPVDADLVRRYPGDPGTRRPVHTVYVPGDALTAGTLRSWGDRALAALDEHAPDAASFAAVLGIPGGLAEQVYTRVRAKLDREPVGGSADRL